MVSRKVISPSWRELAYRPNFVSPLSGAGPHLASSVLQVRVGLTSGGSLASGSAGSGPKCTSDVLLAGSISGSTYMSYPRPGGKSG